MKNPSGVKTLLVRAAFEIGVFSLVINLLQLAAPLYLLQIYDRVLPSSSTETLTFLTLVIVAALVAMGFLEAVRSFYGYRLVARITARLGTPALIMSMIAPGGATGETRPLQDLQAIKTCVESRAVFSLFDLPFVPIFAVILYAVHPAVFLLAMAGLVLLILITVANQMVTASSSREAAEQSVAANYLAHTFARNAETLLALGMVRNAVEHWGNTFAGSLTRSDRVARFNTVFSGASRTVRTLLQSVILGLAAYLVIKGELTGGMIFASSIIAGRIFQPFDQVIGSWRLLAESLRAANRLRKAAGVEDLVGRNDFELPDPKGELVVENLVYRAPGAKPGKLPLIKGITFGVRPGQTVAVVGPSKAGKSTLARLIVGAAKPVSGVIRIDGADIASWKFDELGRHIGYLSQDVELFPGTVGQNIARFDPAARDEDIVAAARRAQVEDIILGLESNYSTQIGGPAGVRLSGGERQRIALARAFYGNPKLVVLDEPNSSLDTEGEAALARAVLAAKDEKTTILLITHRLSIAQQCDQVLVMKDGAIDKYGPARQVLEVLQNKVSQVRPAPAGAAPAGAAPATANRKEGGNATGRFTPMSMVARSGDK